MALELIVALGVAAFLFLYFAFKLEANHALLKIFLIFMFFILLTLIPSSHLNDNCTTQVANETVVDNTTSYEYKLVCDSTDTTQEISFLKVILWTFRFFGLYFLIYIFYHAVKKSELFVRWLGKKK